MPSCVSMWIGVDSEQLHTESTRKSVRDRDCECVCVCVLCLRVLVSANESMCAYVCVYERGERENVSASECGCEHLYVCVHESIRACLCMIEKLLW
jgi:hypothetical protein